MTDAHALFQNYSTPGPRYTSYPTAPYFHTGVGNANWGGGTPTYLKPQDITRLMSRITERFSVVENTELGCEADPRELSREHLVALREEGD